MLLGGDGPVYLGQLIVLSNGNLDVSITVKTDAPSLHASSSARRFVDLVLSALGPYHPRKV